MTEFGKLKFCISEALTGRAKIAHWKSLTSGPFVYFHVTLVHSKGRDQGQAYLDFQYLVNDNIWRNITITIKENDILFFDEHIYF